MGLDRQERTRSGDGKRVTRYMAAGTASGDTGRQISQPSGWMHTAMTYPRAKHPGPAQGGAAAGLRLLLVLAVLLLAACRVEFYTHLPEEDANEMLSILLRHGIDARKVRNKKDDSYNLYVAQSQLPEALRLLKERGYPRERTTRIEDLFRKEGLISSPLEERVRFIYALSQNVQETLSRIDGVVTARVHIVLPENDPFSEHIRPSSASVFIKYLPESHLEDIKSEIKHIVQRSIEGLSYDKVSVVMLPADTALGETGDAVAWRNLWGVRLPSDSVARFRMLVWSLVAIVLILLGALLYVGWQIVQWQQSGKLECTLPFTRGGGRSGREDAEKGLSGFGPTRE